MVRPEVEFRKQQILRKTSSELLILIRDKFDVGQSDEEFETDMLEGLHAAVSQRPSIAVAICPALVESGELRLIRIFLELMPNLWSQNRNLMLRLLKQAQHITDPEIVGVIADMLGYYHEKVLPSSPGFRKYLKAQKL